ncbi:tetratricopeptide repeat protein [Sphaerisporangium aureirubrum]|uniref:Tetratricopeptide repeat protein n=1 Tax=Sphaerisporangium aureirubrum TaxID=1544736 RepID=A0ABW1NAP3_9ACTN
MGLIAPGDVPEPSPVHIDAQVHDKARLYVAGRDLTISTTPPPTDVYKQGVTYLRQRQYSLATTALEQATLDVENSTQAHFLLAVALLHGKRPRLHEGGRRGIKRIERELRQTLAQSPGHVGALLLWAIIKEDYYRQNGFDFDPPAPEEMLSSALGALGALGEDDENVPIILAHVEASGSRVRRVLEEYFG